MPDSVTDIESPSSIIHQIDINYFLSLVGITILYYDYVLTLDEEVSFFWRKRTGTVSVLFFSNRYVSILGSAALILQTFGRWPSKVLFFLFLDRISWLKIRWRRRGATKGIRSSCDNLQKYHQFLSIVVQIIVGIIMILRTYALYELNRKILWILSSLAGTIIVIGIWSVIGDFPSAILPYNISSIPGCHTLISRGLGIRLAAAWGSLFAFDTVVIILTLRKAIQVKKAQNQKLYHVLIRDGTIYYLVFSLINLAQILLFVIGTPLLRGVLTTFANVVSTTLISRLMLNLKNPRLFQQCRSGETTMSTLGAFVAPAPNIHIELQTFFSDATYSSDDRTHSTSTSRSIKDREEWT
ncbi:hypothetical protein ACEPAG_8796 [Sanghuangporus baumii]